MIAVIVSSGLCVSRPIVTCVLFRLKPVVQITA